MTWGLGGGVMGQPQETGVDPKVIFKSERYVKKLEKKMNEMWEHFWPILGASF